MNPFALWSRDIDDFRVSTIGCSRVDMKVFDCRIDAGTHQDLEFFLSEILYDLRESFGLIRAIWGKLPFTRYDTQGSYSRSDNGTRTKSIDYNCYSDS